MSKTTYTGIRLVTIGCLVLVFAFSIAWAATYYASKSINKGGGTIVLNSDAKVSIPKDALTDYLKEQQKKSVEITVEMIEILDDDDVYGLIFIFGPSGTYFDPPLQLILKGDYVNDGMMLFNDAGEAMEYTLKKDGNTIIFYILHFSRYSYDMYSYY